MNFTVNNTLKISNSNFLSKVGKILKKIKPQKNVQVDGQLASCLNIPVVQKVIPTESVNQLNKMAAETVLKKNLSQSINDNSGFRIRSTTA